MNEISFVPSLVKIVAALAIVLGLMVAAVHLMKRFLNHPSSGSRGGSLIQVVAARGIGPKATILLVDVLGKGLVVGLSNGQMSLLTAIDDGQALEKMKNLRHLDASSPALGDFIKRYAEKIKTLNGREKGMR